MPVKQALEMANSYADGSFGLSDVATTVDFGMECLNAFLDPLGCLAGQALDFLLRPLMDWAISLVPPLDALWGSPEDIAAYATRVNEASAALADAANGMVDSADDIPSWTGRGANQYHEVLQGMYSTLKSQSQATSGSAELLRAVGAVAAMTREFLWSLIKDFLAGLIRNAIIALASSWFSFGSSIAVYMTWAAGKYAWVCGKVAHYLSKAFDWLAKISSKLGPLSKMLANVAASLRHVRAVQFGRAGGLANSANTIRTNPGRAAENVPDTPNTGVPAAGSQTSDSADTGGDPSDSIRDFPE